jgi:glucuronokinase
MADLHAISCREGYFGGLRLLQATCKAFYRYCRNEGIGKYSNVNFITTKLVLSRRNFTLSYDTNIPRQVGLAGSSAIVTSTLKCLMNFFNLTENDLPKPKRASLALDVETSELFIQAGLQDRVVQTYEGLVDMDFAKELVQEQGYGHYANLNVKALPTLFLVYCPNPSDSGKIHSTVKHRWLSGDKEVIDGMNNFRSVSANKQARKLCSRNFTTEARQAIEAENWTNLQKLMDKNFEQRRNLYGDACLGVENLKMISIAKEYGASAKFSGSGGAIVGLLLEESKENQMKSAFQVISSMELP